MKILIIVTVVNMARHNAEIEGQLPGIFEGLTGCAGLLYSSRKYKEALAI